MISEPLFQPKVAKMVAKASGFFNFFNSRVMDSVFFQLTCDYWGISLRAQITMKNNYYILAAATPKAR